MLYHAVLLCLVGISFSKGDNTYKCFSCEYRPSSTRAVLIPITEEFETKVPKTTFECKTEKVFDGYQITQQGYEQQQSYGKQQGYGKQGDDQQGYGQHPKYRILKRCFSKVVYETKKEVRTRYDTKLETIPAGGFESCMGPITEESAQSSGVDNLTCRDNCYARKDSYGNVIRGCYTGESNVDPDLLGCNVQAGQTYCFCNGNFCNGDAM